MKGSLAAYSMLGLLLLSGRASAQAPTRSEMIDRFVSAEMARQRIPGMAVAVLRGDSVLLSRGYGWADLERRVAATDSTLFAIGSVTKQFAAAAVVLLAQQRRLNLDDPITKYLPEGARVWRGITIRHLLTHTSGIPDNPAIDFSRDYTETELVRSAAAQALEFKPGEMESYSTTGYDLLGVIIHRASGSFWGDFVRDQIFRPLGMRTAQVNAAVGNIANRAAGYGLVNDTLQKNQDQVSPSINSAAGCCLSLTARDFVHWAKGLNHGKVLGRDGLRMSWTPVRLNNGGAYPYGFGWNLFEQRGYRRIGHSGAWAGNHATIQRYPDFDLTIVVMLNLGQANSEGIATGIAGLVEPALAAPQLLEHPLSTNPPVSIERLVRALAEGRDSTLVTPELRATFPKDRREILKSFLTALQTWTPLGCDEVSRRGIIRLRSRIEHICYAKGSGKPGSLLFTVPYDRNWQAVGLDNVFGI